MKMRLLFASMLLVISQQAFAVLCTITDSKRVPVGETEPLTYEHKRSIGDFNCSCDNKDIPAEIRTFCKNNKLNSSSGLTISAAEKAIAAKQAVATKLSAAQQAINRKASELSQKFDDLGKSGAEKINATVDRYGQKLNDSRLGAAGRAADEHISDATEALHKSRLGQATQKAVAVATMHAEAAGRAIANKSNAAAAHASSYLNNYGEE